MEERVEQKEGRGMAGPGARGREAKRKRGQAREARERDLMVRRSLLGPDGITLRRAMEAGCP